MCWCASLASHSINLEPKAQSVTVQRYSCCCTTSATCLTGEMVQHQCASFLFYTFILNIDDPQQSIKLCTTGLCIVTVEERHNDRIACKSDNVLPGVMALAIICIWNKRGKGHHSLSPAVSSLLKCASSNKSGLCAKTWGWMQLKAEEKNKKLDTQEFIFY